MRVTSQKWLAQFEKVDVATTLLNKIHSSYTRATKGFAPILACHLFCAKLYLICAKGSVTF